MKAIDYRIADVHREVQALDVPDYSSGPLRDDKGRPRDLWVFGKFVEEYEVYIKLSAYLAEGAVRVVCVSFHEAAWPLVYPYKKAS